MGTSANLISGPGNIYIKDSGTVTGTTSIVGGSGYTSVPTITYSPPPLGGVQATGTAVLTSQALTGITITNPGAGYRVPPIITVTGGGGSGASAISVLTLADTNIGFTKGGVKVEVTPKVLDLMTDQLGTTEVNTIITGVQTKVSVPFAEITLLNFARIFANAVTVQDDTTGSKRRVEIQPLAGKSLLAIAKQLTIKPMDPNTGLETTNKDLWVTVPLAAPDTSTVAIDYATETQRIVTVVFKAFPDVANNNRTLYFGDSTAVDTDQDGF